MAEQAMKSGYEFNDVKLCYEQSARISINAVRLLRKATNDQQPLLDKLLSKVKVRDVLKKECIPEITSLLKKPYNIESAFSIHVSFSDPELSER